MKCSPNTASKVLVICPHLIDMKHLFVTSQIPEVKQCRIPVIAALKVCLSEEADNDLDTVDATIDGALDFICYKGGERIASILPSLSTIPTTNILLQFLCRKMARIVS